MEAVKTLKDCPNLRSISCTEISTTPISLPSLRRLESINATEIPSDIGSKRDI